MSKLFFKSIKHQIFFLGFLIFLPQLLHSQISMESDTSTREEYYSFLDIDLEIEKINKYIKSTQKYFVENIEAKTIDSSFIILSEKIEKEEEEFNNYNHKTLSKFFLINTHEIWSVYESQLRNWQSYTNETLTDLDEQTNQLSEKKEKWKKTLSKSETQKLPNAIRRKLKKVLKEIGELQKLNYQYSMRLLNLEYQITDKVLTVKNVIFDVEDLQKNYRSQVFSATVPEIWNIQLKDSFSGTIKDRLKKVWHENTKSFHNNSGIYLSDLWSWLIICMFWLGLFMGIKFQFGRFFSLDNSPSKHNLNYIFINRPTSTLISFFILFFFIIFTNIPLALKGIMSLLLILTVFIALNPFIKNAGRNIIIKFIILLILNNLEIVFWYFGDYSRLFITLEATLGALFIYEYLTKNFTLNVLPNLRFRGIIKAIRYPVFLLFAIAFVANIFGFLNLAVLLIKISVKMTSAIIIAIGLWHMTLSFILVLVDLFRKHEKIRLLHYLPLIKKRLIQFFALLYFYLLFNVVLDILEINAPFYNFLDEFMNYEHHLGGVVFNYKSIFQFVVILIITYGLYALIGIIFDNNNFKKSHSLRGVPAAIATTLRIIIGLSGLMIALTAVGFNMERLSIIIGALGIGIGFGLQNIVNNFISGLILIYERPIQVGDIIEIGPLMGEIKSIGIRSSSIRTYDGSEVIVPNSNLVSDQLVNWTLSDNHRRIEIIIGVAYGTDPNMVINILTDVANNHPDVLRIPNPTVLFNEFGDSSLNFRLLFWVLFENGISTKSAISVAIDKAFKENNIEIPFPQLDLHMKEKQKVENEESTTETSTEKLEKDLERKEISKDE